MPYTVRKRGRGRRPWAIVNRITGRVAGWSATKKAAAISAAIRNRKG